MVVKLVFEEYVSDGLDWPPRIAERDFEWEESMGGAFSVPNPANPKDVLQILWVWDNIPDTNGKQVLEVEVKVARFEDVLQYGFTEKKWCMNSDCHICPSAAHCCLGIFYYHSKDSGLVWVFYRQKQGCLLGLSEKEQKMARAKRGPCRYLGITLLHYLNNDVTDTQRKRVEKHLPRCARCRKEMSFLEAAKRIFDAGQ